MNVAMLHYHLGQGGVTRVLANHARALGKDARIAAVHGGRRDGWGAGVPGVELVEVDGLGYADGPPRPGELAVKLRAALAGIGFEPKDTILHVHNHGLGKNLSLPGALHVLAGDGYAVLLQTHDFAEDFRAVAHRRMVDALEDPAALLYASAEHVHHAVLNRRDEGVLRRTGIPAERIHLLPNPVPDGTEPASRGAARDKLAARRGVPQDTRLLVYPVRGIRRKNVGETLLWSLLQGDGGTVALTLAPQNPAERHTYDRWKALARRLDAPLLFELGDELTLAESFAACDQVLTTSVAEGFGLVFLEPWLAGRSLVGRDLPEVTSDFTASGLDLTRLEERLDVPVGWIGEERVRAALLAAYREVLALYRHPEPAGLDEGVSFHLRDRRVDFAALTEELQAEVVESVHRDGARRAEILERNPWIGRALDADSELVEHNAATVRRAFSLEVCGGRLRRIYGQLRAAARTDLEPPERPGEVLGSFLDLRRFHPLRVAS